MTNVQPHRQRQAIFPAPSLEVGDWVEVYSGLVGRIKEIFADHENKMVLVVVKPQHGNEIYVDRCYVNFIARDRSQ